MASEMIALCRLDEIADGGGKALEVIMDGTPQALVAVRRGEQAWLYRNCCPHFSVPLDYTPGDFCTYHSTLLMCAHHSAMFRFEDGKCVDGPCAGSRLEAVMCRVEDGLLLVNDSNAVIAKISQNQAHR